MSIREQAERNIDRVVFENRLPTLFEQERLTPEEQELVRKNLDLAYAVAEKYTSYGRKVGLDYLDLVQEAVFGLMKAVQKFDPTRGVKLSTLMWHAATNAIKMALEKAPRFKRHVDLIKQATGVNVLKQQPVYRKATV